MVAGLLNKNVFFRCDGGSDLGLGHITRSIELALGFKKLGLKKIIFFVFSDNHNVFKRIKKNGFKFYKCPFSLGTKKDLLFMKKFSNLEDNNNSILICDTFCLKDYYLKEYSKYFFLVLINELKKNKSYSNILIGTSEKNNKSIIPLYGKKTNLIRKEFINSNNKKVNNNQNKILITMGAGDPDNVTSWFLSNFVNELKNEEIYVLLGGAYKYKKQIYKKFSKLYKNIKIFYDLEKPSNVMKKSYFAISSSGNMSLELAALGIPQLLVSLDKTQRIITKFLVKKKCALNLGFYKNLKKIKVGSLIKDFINKKSFRNIYKINNPNIFHSEGSLNIAKLIIKKFDE